jgi:hypothetical protein
MNEKMLRGMETRYANAIRDLPEEYIMALNETISRKLSLPAQLISIRGVTHGIYKSLGTTRDILPWPVKEGLHRMIAERLEQEGGVLSELTSHRSGTTVKEQAFHTRIYRFPPLKERKR